MRRTTPSHKKNEEAAFAPLSFGVTNDRLRP